MQISIVVPTRDRPGALARCLAALGGRPSSRSWSSTTARATARRSRGALEAAAGARLVHAGGHGPAAARNLGARPRPAGRLLHRRRLRAGARAGREPARGARDGAVARRRAGPSRRPGRPPRSRASQAIVEHLTLASLDPATGRLGFAPSCNLAVDASGARAAAVRRVVPDAPPARTATGAPAPAAPGSGPRYVPEARASSTARSSGWRAFVRQQYALRARRGALSRRRRAAGGSRGPASTPGSCGAGSTRGRRSAALVVAAQAARPAAAERARPQSARRGAATRLPARARPAQQRLARRGPRGRRRRDLAHRRRDVHQPRRARGLGESARRPGDDHRPGVPGVWLPERPEPAPVAAHLAEARRAQRRERGRGALGPADDEVGQPLGVSARVELGGAHDRRRPAGAPSGSAKVARPAAISSQQRVGLARVDDPVALAAAQVEPHVALVVGRVGEGAGRRPVESRAARAAR